MLQDAGPLWLAKARRAALTLTAQTRRARGARHSVYVVLLHDERRADPWGLYVGQTSRDPDLRFDQHKTGYKASGPVRRFGLSRSLTNNVAKQHSPTPSCARAAPIRTR